MGLEGSFLKRPVEEKISKDDFNSKMSYGVSSMQGWRIRQEDAHNCILNFDDDTSLFAVYDGHGGPEVAAYASAEFPKCLRNVEEYKKGLYTEALINAFLKFDDSLITPKALNYLLLLNAELDSGYDYEDGEDDSEDDSNPVCSSHACGSSSGGCSSSKICDNDDDEDLESLRIEASQALHEVMASLNKKLGKLCGTRVDSSRFEAESGSASSASGSSSNHQQVETTPEGSSAVVEQNGSSSSKTASNDTSIHNAEVESDLVKNTKDGSGDQEKSTSISDKWKAANVDNVANNTSSKNCQQSQDLNTETLPKRIPKEPSSMLEDQPGTSPTKKKLSFLNLSDIDVVKNFITSDEIEESDEDDSEDETFRLSKNDRIQDEEDDDDDDEEEDDDDYEKDDDDSDEEDETEDNESSDGVVDESDDDDDEKEDTSLDESHFSNEMREKPGYCSGCTAVVAFIQGNDLYVANAGDSRCILSVNGVAVDMTEDHNPEFDQERKRIIEAGGKIRDGRVNGDLNLSRAFGDHRYKLNTSLSNKEQMVTALPDVKTAKIGPDTDFLVLICDGVWNCITNQELVDFIRPKLEAKQKLSSICEQVFDKCLAESCYDYGNDNMTCIIVDLHPNIMSSPQSSTSGGVKMSDDEAVKTAPVKIEAANTAASIIKENQLAAAESCHQDVSVADESGKMTNNDGCPSRRSQKHKLNDVNEIPSDDNEIPSKKAITEEDNVDSRMNS